ncbi:MAG: rhodanese-like domain-containing protein [Acidobacteriota bacterium]
MNNLLVLVLYLLFFTLGSASPRDIPAFVSAEWLSQNLERPNLFILDIRNKDSYQQGHIPGSLHAPFSSWVAQRDNLLLELPPEKALREHLGSLGLSRDALVVIVNKTDTDWNRADATRVAWTCILAGVQNASVLDGGINRWLRLGLPTSAETVPARIRNFDSPLDTSSLIQKEELMGSTDRFTIIDGRIPEEYFGIPPGYGHIPGAHNLPVPWLFNSDGTIREASELKAMASSVVGSIKDEPVVVYCQVGGFASALWFILTEKLEYRNVRIFDGSYQEWSQDPDAPVASFCWE